MATITVHNPYDDSLVGEVRVAGKADIARALDVAAGTFPATRCTPAAERSQLLQRISEALGRHAAEFTDLIVAEAGKPVTLARVEVERARATFELAAAAALQPDTLVFPMDATPAGAGHRGSVRRFPLGVILGITPFNFPLNLVAHKVAPALATGNTMIVKPSPRTPLTALRLAGLLEDCGAPPGQITVLPFDHDHVGAVLRDPRVKMLSFTGSAEIGWRLKADAIKKKVTLELGGDAACLVAADADWEAHLAKIVTGAFGFAGQSCISVQRLIVERSILPHFREAFLAQVDAQAITGDPRDPRTLVGPMIDGSAVECTVQKIREAESRSARLLTPLRVEGRILHPVVLEDVPRESAILREEAFAPVVILQGCEDFAAGLQAVNDSRYGLQAGVLTRDPGKARLAYDTLEVGGVLVNQVPTFRTENMPYGGVKDSGCGREGLPWALEDMTEPKVLVVNEIAP